MSRFFQLFAVVALTSACVSSRPKIIGGIEDRPIVNTYADDYLSDLDTLSLATNYREFIRASDVTWLYIDRAASSTVVAFANPQPEPQKSTRVGYPDLELYSGFASSLASMRANLLIIAPPCHYSNRILMEYNGRNGLECWANFERDSQKLKETLVTHFMSILKAQVKTSQRICILGNSRFGYIALSAIPDLLESGFEPLLFLISPVVNLQNLSEFRGIIVNDQKDMASLSKVKVFASTMSEDSRVGAESLFSLAKNINSDHFIIETKPGIGHTDFVGPISQNSFGDLCR